MREAIDEITVAVDSLLKLSSEYDRGQCIPWGRVESVAGLRTEPRSKYVIGKWRRRLFRDREIVTLCANEVGVRLLTHKETAQEIPAMRQRKAYRQIRKALSETSTVNVDRLSTHERKLLAAQRANMASQRRELFRSRKQLANGSTATEVNPRRKVSA